MHCLTECQPHIGFDRCHPDDGKMPDGETGQKARFLTSGTSPSSRVVRQGQTVPSCFSRSDPHAVILSGASGPKCPLSVSPNNVFTCHPEQRAAQREDPRAQRSESTRQRSCRHLALPGEASRVGLRPKRFARGFFAMLRMTQKALDKEIGMGHFDLERSPDRLP